MKWRKGARAKLSVPADVKCFQVIAFGDYFLSDAVSFLTAQNRRTVSGNPVAHIQKLVAISMSLFGEKRMFAIRLHYFECMKANREALKNSVIFLFCAKREELLRVCEVFLTKWDPCAAVAKKLPL